jgi:hypothetical protein
MEAADQGYSKLTPEENHRNKRVGDMNIYFLKSDETPLQQATLKEG